MVKGFSEIAKKFRRKPAPMPIEDYLKKLLDKGLNPDGTPMLDPTPLAPPVGYRKQPSLIETVRDMVRSERLAAAAREAGMETFEESEDFDVGDDPELMRSQWENEFDPPLSEIVNEGLRVLREREANQAAATSQPVAPKAPQKGAEQRPPSDGPEAGSGE